MGVLWIVFVGGVRRDEMLVGAVVLIACGAFAYRVWQIEPIEVDFRWKDVAEGWRLPWYVLRGVVTIVSVFVKDLIGVKRADSLYLVCGFETGKTNPLLVGRRVLATFYSTMTPTSIVIGIDYAQSRMLFHELEHGSVSPMMKALGAKVGARRP
ncbi:MAG: hypothetical protein WBY53_11035 [Acidobacteriaceae bacterium]